VIAALYVERDGVYYGLPDVDPWDEERDARFYDGPWPVVAHPPCQRWCRFAKQVEGRFGYVVGDDGGCFEAALEAVRTYGGVLEHPADSLAWDAFDLPKPRSTVGWTLSLLNGDASCYVEQGRYGLPMRKATWLYAYGVELADLRWGRRIDSEGGEFRWGSYLYKGAPNHERPRLSATILSKTTTEFRDALLDMARTAMPPDDPTRLATEGRALPYMGRRRLDQGDDLAG
jgi:hypothetical protein